jgi:16S rRNA (guanine527-N7)-methyltransferase
VREAIDFGLANIAALEPPAEFLAQTSAIGIEFEPGDVERLGRYLAMLLKANERTNLTGITDPAQAWERHIFDSLTLMRVLAELPEGARVLDVGSGGGLPGLPLAIVCPGLRFTLLEATGKKVDFLRQASQALGLDNVEVLHARAEAAAHDRGERTKGGRAGGHREQYDVVVARAVGAMNVLAELTVPFAKAPVEGKASGVVALIKGEKAEAELAAAGEALRRLKAEHVVTIETSTGRIVVLGKSGATPRMYPRRDGEPKRSPLGGGKRGER